MWVVNMLLMCVTPGALTNTLGGMDHRTNKPPRPTDIVGEEHVDSLEFGARMLMRWGEAAVDILCGALVD